MKIEQRDVVIVGGGPVGLSVALGLARSGADVLVLEKDPKTAEHSRAPAIWPRTQEIFAKLGVVERFIEAGISLPCLELWDTDRQRVLLRLPIEALREETAHPRLLILPQSMTERLLYEAIRSESNAEVRFSSEVVGLAESRSGVKVQYRVEEQEKHVQGRFVAGCDGAHSRVRKALGASFEGITYDMHAALADIIPAGVEDLRFPRLTTNPTLAVAVRITPRLWRLILPFSERSEERPLEKRIDDAAKNLFSRAAYETVWKSEFRLHRRVSSQWVDGRIVLAGDAAHLNSPVGGQGMNAGIVDAAALTEALIEALASDEGTPLAAYAEQRRRAIEGGVNPFTDRLTRSLLAGSGRYVRPIAKGANLMLKIRPLRRRILRRLAMLDQS